MRCTHAGWIAAHASAALLLSLLNAVGGWAQGAPAVIWSSPDGAGAVAFSPGGQILATAGTGLAINLHRASDGVLIRSMRDRSSIGAIAFSPDGQYVADGRTNGTTFNISLFR